MPITILIVDDDPLARRMLRVILDNEPEFEVVGEADDGDVAVDQVAALDPDIVLMDIRMPNVNGIEATRRLVERNPDRPRVLVVTTFEYDEYVYEALKEGARGFLLKRWVESPDFFLRQISSTASGESLVVPRSIVNLINHHNSASNHDKQSEFLLAQLTSREAEVLSLVATGSSNAEVGGKLFISEHTVKRHMVEVLRKLNVRDRTQATVVAYEGGLVSPGGGPEFLSSSG